MEGVPMFPILLSVKTAWSCAFLLTTDEGSVAISDAQEVILEFTEQGLKTRYQIDYEGDAESFGWLIGCSWRSG